MSAYPCYINGEIIPSSEASLKINDLALLRGYGVFDYLRTYNRKPFLLDEHLNRLQNSAAHLHLEIPISPEEIKQTINSLIAKVNGADVGIRLLLTGGYSTDFYTILNPNFLIILEKLPEYDPAIYEKGVKLMLHEYQRELPEAKTINYLAGIRLNNKRIKENAADILYHQNGKVLELTRSNFFLVSGNKLITPSKNILIGMTRNFVMKLSKGLFEVEEREIAIDELKKADEAFLTGTTRKIVPITHIDNITIGTGGIGPHTSKVLNLFNQSTGSL